MQLAHQYKFRSAPILPNVGGAPSLVEMYVSDKCYLRCTHCFHGEMGQHKSIITPDEWLRMAREFYDLGCRRFALGGKEPFAEPMLLHLVRILKSDLPGITVGAVCDGFTWMKYSKDPAIRLLDYLEFSLEGERLVHDSIRGGGSFDRCLNGLRKARTAMPRTTLSVAMALSKVNSHSVGPLWDEINNIGINNLFVQPVEPAGFADKNVCLTATEYSSVIERTLNVNLDSSVPGSILFFVPYNYIAAVSIAGGATLAAHRDSDSRSVYWTKRKKCRIGLMRELIRLPYFGQVTISSKGWYLPHFTLRTSVEANSGAAISALQGGALEGLQCARSRVMQWIEKAKLDDSWQAWDRASAGLFGEKDLFKTDMIVFHES